ncbi:MAG: hypothetical protein QXI71_02210 [Candidatus Bathyarchaeia archaeon]|nr:hypothetical protein [Candidatus Bathyarchaeota archaeon]
MGENKSSLEVIVKFKDVETRFVGKSEDVIQSVLKYFSKIIPGFELISSLTLTIDMENLLKSVKDLMAFTPEGIVITVPREKMGGERDVILTHLVKSYIGFKTGQIGKDSLTMNEIQSFTGGKSGTVGARLSELTSLGWVERVGRGEYRITTLGVKAFLDDVLPKLVPKEESKP